MLKPGNTAMILRIPLPFIFPGAIAELMGATHGMGYYVRNSVAYANYAHVVAGIIVVSIFVTVLNSLTSVL